MTVLERSPSKPSRRTCVSADCRNGVWLAAESSARIPTHRRSSEGSFRPVPVMECSVRTFLEREQALVDLGALQPRRGIVLFRLRRALAWHHRSKHKALR